jgi:hypothetical protein
MLGSVPFTNSHSPHLSAGSGGNFLWRQSIVNDVMSISAKFGRDDGMLERLVLLLWRQTIMLKIALFKMVPGDKTVVGGLYAEVLAMADRMSVIR